MLEERAYTPQALQGTDSPVAQHWRTLLDLAAADKRDFPATLRRMLRAAAAMLNVARVSYWTVHRNPVRMTCDLVYAGEDLWISGTEFRGPENPNHFAALERAALITAFDAANDPRTKELMAAYLHPTGIGAMLDVPIRMGGKLVGVLRHEHIGGVRLWTEEEQKIATAIGNLVALAVSERDRITAESALIESEERFRATFEQNVVGLAHVGLDYRFLWVNRALCEMLGVERNNIAGASVRDFIYTDEEDSTLQMFFRLQSGDCEAVAVDRRFRRADGSTLWGHFSAMLKRRGKDGVDYFVLIVQDVTDRKRAELRAKDQAELVDLTSDAIIVRGIDGTILLWNRGAEVIYGIPRLAAMGVPENELIHTDAAAMEAATRTVLQRGFWHGEMLQQGTDGRSIVVDARWTLMYDEDGTPRSILVTCTEMTERKALRAQFLAS